jgi:hypothetical protein
MLPLVVAFKKNSQKSYANDIPKENQRNCRDRLEEMKSYSPV